MPKFLGEYDVKLDSKARLRLPTDLLRQIEQVQDVETQFVLNRGFEKCLVLYPRYVWDRITKQIDGLNTYVKKNRDFVRYFYRGATEISPDKSERILLPKRLTEYAGIGSEVIIFAYQDRVELWSADEYEKCMGDEPDNYADLAEEVMGKSLGNSED